jgi:hypothetical protein
MKQMYLNVLMALILASAVAGCAKKETPPEEVVDVSMHDNWVNLVPAWSDNVTLAFSENTHSITSGQPWGGVTTGTFAEAWGIDARAGRHASSGPAEWFKSNASAAVCVDWPTSTSQWPGKLNFAFNGTLTIDGVGYPIIFGQGSSDLIHNDWWVGGPGWTLITGFGNAVRTPDGKYYFEPQDDSFSSFWIRTSE